MFRPEETSEPSEKPARRHYGNGVSGTMKTFCGSMFALITAAENVPATTTMQDRKETVSSAVLDTGVREPGRRLEKLIDRIARHEFATRKEAEEAAVILNLAERLLPRAEIINLTPVLKALQEAESAYGLMPREIPRHFGLIQNGRTWTVRSLR